MSGAASQLGTARTVLERNERRLAGELEALIRRRDDAQATLERLDAYLAEYSGTGTGTRRSSGIMNERGFVGRLHHAAGEQRRQHERFVEQTARKTAQWNRARADLAAIDRVIERRLGDARLASARREQRELDTAACRPRDAPGAAGTETLTSLHTERDR